MVNRVGIGNFKSIDKLEFELGRFNVFIGENGCGKSNILEAIGMGAAAAANKLDNEFLVSRGIRVTAPIHMKSGFEKSRSDHPVTVDCDINGNDCKWELFADGKAYSSWRATPPLMEQAISELVSHLLTDKPLSSGTSKEMTQSMQSEMPELLDMVKQFRKIVGDGPAENSHFLQIPIATVKNQIADQVYAEFRHFLIYSPENSSLREFAEEDQIEPLGRKGEGLFKLLKTFALAHPEKVNQIVSELGLFDWFQNLQFPDKTMSGERYIKVKDRFLDDALDQFDQRSTNEGFLFVLFYLALFISEDTPKFFAIDNIEASLNPKLCRELISRLVRLSKEHDKQVIATTHSPAVLDGLDLTDDEQRLFVVYRNSEGRTRVRRVMPPTVMAGETEVPLSEAFVRGYLGGLPKNF